MKRIKNLFKLSTWSRICTWDNINSIGKLKYLNIAFITFIALPILAKIMAKIDTFSITIDNRVYTFDFTMPFNWKLLYFASLSLVIGNLLYYYFCPKIIRLYPDFEHYVKSGMPKIYLHRFLSHYYIKRSGEDHINEIIPFYQKYAKKHNINGYNIKLAIETLRNNDEISGSNFIFVQEIMTHSFFLQRIVSILFYIIGLVLLVWVTFEKIIYTIEYLIIK